MVVWSETPMDGSPPTIELIAPENESTAVQLQPNCNIWANDTDGGELIINFYNNSLSPKFELKDRNFTGSNNYVNTWGDGTYIYAACEDDGLRAYSFDGETLTLIDTIDNGSLYRDVWGDGTYLYTACNTDGIRAYAFNGTDFEWLDTLDNGGSYYGVYGDETYIYATLNEPDGIRAYTFDGSDFTYTGDSKHDGNIYMEPWYYDGYIYVACHGDGIRAYSYDGEDFTLNDTLDNGGNYYSVWGDGTYIYAACYTDGIRAYTFNGTDFDLKGTQDDGGSYKGVWADENYVYAACGETPPDSDTNAVLRYIFNGTVFTLQATQKNNSFDFEGIWGDGTYIYAAGETDFPADPNEGGLYVYRSSAYGHQQRNTSEANATIQWTYSQASAYETDYWWKATVDDGETNVSKWFNFSTISSPPSITINFAGNLSDQRGPYWRPPGESTELTGVWANGYYTNDSRQHEDWIYINCTITDADAVWLNWLNETTWTNWTYSLSNTDGNYWDINTQGTIQTCEGYNYSFDIVANGTGSVIAQWNKTIYDAGGANYTRRYVQLNCTSATITYGSLNALYPYNQQYWSGNKYDILHHDQGTGGFSGNDDIGVFSYTLPSDTIQYVNCTYTLGVWFNEPICAQPFTLDNIYYHLWVNTSDEEIDRLGYKKTKSELSSVPSEYINYEYRNNSKSNFTYDFGDVEVHFDLIAHNHDISNIQFTDNDIYEFMLNIYNNDMPYLFSNRSYLSFILLNVPDNSTLNASYTDSDSDELSDWTELYVTYTNPFVADTDNDGYNDSYENATNTDPNDFTDYQAQPPDPPTNLTTTAHGVEYINITWTKALDADYTYIERNATAVTSWVRGEGTQVYNNTGAAYNDEDASVNMTLYYQAWSWNDTNKVWSTNYASNNTKMAPTIFVISPENQSTGIGLQPNCYVQVNTTSEYFIVDIYNSTNGIDFTHQQHNVTSEISTFIMRPNGEGALTEWSAMEEYAPSGSPNWQMVDEENADSGDTAVGIESTDDYVDLYNVTNHTAEFGYIIDVNVTVNAYETESGGSLYVLINDTVNQQAIEVGLEKPEADWCNNTVTFETNPSGGPWTWDDIDDLQIGLLGQIAWTLVSQIYAEVRYVPGVIWNYSQATEYDTTYYWKVTANDMTARDDCNVSGIYQFTTEPSGEEPVELSNFATSHYQRHDCDWINFSATITNATEVWLNITSQRGDYSNESITANNSGNTYWCNRTFDRDNNDWPDMGNRTHAIYIFANNTNNESKSSNITITIYPRCDVNQDNNTDAFDLTEIKTIDWESAGDIRFSTSDVNSDGDVDAFDLTRVKTYEWGWSGTV